MRGVGVGALPGEPFLLVLLVSVSDPAVASGGGADAVDRTREDLAGAGRREGEVMHKYHACATCGSWASVSASLTEWYCLSCWLMHRKLLFPVQETDNNIQLTEKAAAHESPR
jgi:hypothetical protein